MPRIRLVSDRDECERLWKLVVPPETLWDLWEVRRCFDANYDRPPLFVVAEGRGRIDGLLPLSWIGEANQYGYFPGETWDGKTWIEQNRVFARDGRTREMLVQSCPAPHHLRYLRKLDSDSTQPDVDEIGYLFQPPRFDYRMDEYFKLFSGKSLKRLNAALGQLESMGLSYRYNDLSDFDIMVSQNLGRFEERSYFHDIRFRESIRSMMMLLHERDMLRITTILVAGTPAAVDLGCVYNNNYTLVAGGTSGQFMGIAKLINIQHMRWACEQRIDEVDFLCGAFSWKPMFHLTERPLYLLSNVVHAELSEDQGISSNVG